MNNEMKKIARAARKVADKLSFPGQPQVNPELRSLIEIVKKKQKSIFEANHEETAVVLTQHREQ